MNRKDNFEIGYANIDEILLYKYHDPTNKYDITNFVYEINFSEAVTSHCMYGYLSIVDTYNFIDRVPLLGEEIISIRTKDLFGNEFVKEFWCHKLDTLTVTDQISSTTYKLHFSSPCDIFARSKDISRSYNNKKISDVVNNVFDELYNVPSFPSTLEYEETTGSQTLIIPDLNGIDSMSFLRRRAYSIENKSSNFLFFETKNKHVFKTHEQLIKETRDSAQEFFHNPNVNVSLKNRLDSMNMIHQIGFPTRYSLTDEQESGAMVTDIAEIDLLRKQYILHNYKYNDIFDKYTHHQKNALFPHTPIMIEDFFQEQNNTKTQMVFMDRERENQYYQSLLGYKTSIKYFTNTIFCRITIYGRNDLNAGDCMYLNLPVFQNLNQGEARPENSFTSGYWTIHTINSTITSENKYFQNILLFKDAYSNG